MPEPRQLECYITGASVYKDITISLYHPESRRLISRGGDWKYVRAEVIKKIDEGDSLHKTYQKVGKKIVVNAAYFDRTFERCIAKQTIEKILSDRIEEDAKKIFPEK